VLTAVDLSDRSSAKVEEAVGVGRGVEWVRSSTVERLGRAIGKETVGVLAIEHRTLGPQILAEARRIAELKATAAQ
jgi:hypothetical protein